MRLHVSARSPLVGRRTRTSLVSCGITFGEGDAKFTPKRASCERSHSSMTRGGNVRVKPLPLASQGGSATRNDERLPRRPLRLRFAPPSARSREMQPALLAQRNAPCGNRRARVFHLCVSPVASAQITTLQRADVRRRSRRASCLARGACTPASTRAIGDRATLAPHASPHRC